MLKKRLALNFGANLFAQATTVVVQLASVPLFLSFWSKEQYGAWLLISAIPVYLSLGEAGFATAAANEVSMAVAEGNMEKARRSLHTAWGFLAGVSGVLVLLTIGAFFAVPWNEWLKLSSVTGSVARWTIFLLSLYTIAGIVTGIFGAIYRAVYRNARSGTVNSVARLVELAAIALGVTLTSSMVVLAGAMLAVRLLFLVFYYVDTRVLSTDLRLGVKGFSVPEFGRVWRPSIMFMASGLGNAIYFQGLTLLVGASLGAAAVVVFNTTRTLTRVIVQFVTVIKQSIWPEFSYLFGTGDLERARRLNELFFEVSWVASVALAAGIYLAGPWIMPLWTHHAVQIDPPLLAIFLASAVLNGVWSATSGFLYGTNQHEGLTIRYVVAASLALVLAVVGVRHLGMYGVASAMVVCELVLLPYAISRTCHLLRQPLKNFLCATLQLRSVRQTTVGYYHRWLANTG